MRRWTMTALLAAAWALAGLGTSTAGEPNTLSEAEKAAGWKLLFDGQTTHGWRGYQRREMPPGWKVTDGILSRESGGAGGKGAGGGDDIVTVDQYQNFELKVDWKIVAGANSGILYRVVEDPPASWEWAPEMQILDNSKYVGRDARQLAGACYDLYASSKDMSKPAGQWNEARVVVNGNHVEHWLNGQQVVTYELHSRDWTDRVAKSKFKDKPHYGQAAKGLICLQDHSDKVQFRNIKLRVLPAAGP